MKKITIVAVVCNELENIKLTFNTWKAFSATGEQQFVVINNGGTDAIAEWVMQNPDIVFVDRKRTEGWAKIVNSVLTELKIENDIFCITSGFMFAQNIMNKLQRAVYEEKRIGCAGPVFGNASICQRVDGICTTEEALAYRGKEHSYEVMGLYYKAIYFRYETLKEIGGFEERLRSMEQAMEDYMLRMIRTGWKRVVAEDALMFRFGGSNKEYLEQLTGPEYISMEQKWGMHYFNFVGNRNLLPFITKEPEEEFSVLEIGCDWGATLFEIGTQYVNVDLYGVELNPHAAEIANCFAKVEVANIEDQDIPFEKKGFDYIIFGDVLEHLRNPEATVLYCKELLKEDGRILASIPNLMNIQIMKEILEGNFTYEETGLLDKTHIHWFTYYEILRMFMRCGYEMEMISSTVSSLSEEDEKWIEQLLKFSSNTQKFMYEAFQYIICAKNIRE